MKPVAIYSFERARKKDGTPLKSRFDCTKKEGKLVLPPLEQSKARTPDTFTIEYKEPTEKHKGPSNPEMTIWAPAMLEMGRKKKLTFYTGVFYPSLEKPRLAYADGNNSNWPCEQNMVLLIEFTEDHQGMKIMVFQDEPAKKEAYFQAWIDGDIEEDCNNNVFEFTETVTGAVV